MPLQQATLTINRPDLQRQVAFQLDTQQMSQRVIFDALSLNKLYEAETTLLVSSLLQPGDGFVDIGAHVGFFSMLAATCVGPRGRVWAFEPEHANYSHLLAHLSLNQMHNVQPFQWAVGDQSRVVDFYLNLDNDGGHALWDPGRHPLCSQTRAHPSKTRVFQVNLDDLFVGASPGMVKVMKIDVEGNEVCVLKGARKFLRAARVPAVIAEVNAFGMAQLNNSEREMREFMAELGYIPYLLLFEKPTRLTPEQYFQSKYVFNLLFVSQELQQVVATQWPQTTSLINALQLRGEQPSHA